jgi:hypothetical protein
LEIVWLSHPASRHSANLAANPGAAIAVYDSRQEWTGPDRGLQVFGTAGERKESTAHAYERRFPAARDRRTAAYRFYGLQPSRMKLFDEAELGPGTFVTVTVQNGAVAWESTEVYRSG